MSDGFDYDVVIIGCGPAGAAAGLTLAKRPDLNVLIVDNADPERPYKVGESLSPGVRSLLKYLDVWEAFEQEQNLSLWGNEAAWGQADMSSMDFIYTLHGAGWSLDRTAFENLFRDALCQRNIPCRSQTRLTDISPDGEGWQLILSDPNQKPYAIRSKFVIDASGRNSPWPVKLGMIRKRFDNLVGLTGWMPSRPNINIETLTRVEACEYGWWYAVKIPNEQIVVSLMSDGHIIHDQNLSDPEHWLNALHATRHIRHWVDPTHELDRLTLSPAFSSRLDINDTAHAFVSAGDAVASHDPLSSSGIPHALGSGIQAGRVAAAHVSGDASLKIAYYQSIEADFTRYLQTQWKTYKLEKRWPNASFWRFRQARPTLDPNTLCHFRHVSVPSSLFVPKPVSKKICKLASTRRPAHEIVAAIKKQTPEITDERIILAVEELCAHDQV